MDDGGNVDTFLLATLQPSQKQVVLFFFFFGISSDEEGCEVVEVSGVRDRSVASPELINTGFVRSGSASTDSCILEEHVCNGPQEDGERVGEQDEENLLYRCQGRTCELHC